MTKDLKLHIDVVTIQYVQSSPSKYQPDKPRWVIGALREGTTLDERYLSFATENALYASICERAKATGQKVVAKWRYTYRFDGNLLWCELAKESEKVSA